jgi:hypothetical protein
MKGLREQNGVPKEEILLSLKVTRIRIRFFGSIRRSTEPKSDPSVSKVVQQLPCWIEALQGSKAKPKQPLRKVDAQVCENRHPPIGNEDRIQL